MSVIPADEPSGFWRKLAQALDARFADRSLRAVPAAALRRSKREVARCRRLMHKTSASAVEGSLGGRRGS